MLIVQFFYSKCRVLIRLVWNVKMEKASEMVHIFGGILRTSLFVGANTHGGDQDAALEGPRLKMLWSRCHCPGMYTNIKINKQEQRHREDGMANG